MSKQKKRINEETANETGKTEGKKERDYAGGRERESGVSHWAPGYGRELSIREKQPHLG